MKINWTQRFRNKTWITVFILGLINIIYQTIAAYQTIKTGSLPQEVTIQFATTIISYLVQIGVIIDPTTKGINDSERAMNYGNDEEVK